MLFSTKTFGFRRETKSSAGKNFDAPYPNKVLFERIMYLILCIENEFPCEGC